MNTFTFTSTMKLEPRTNFLLIETSTPLRIRLDWAHNDFILLSPCHQRLTRSRHEPKASCSTCGASWHFRGYEEGRERMSTATNHNLIAWDSLGEKFTLWLETMGDLSPLASMLAVEDLLEAVQRWAKVRDKLLEEKVHEAVAVAPNKVFNFRLSDEEKLLMCRAWN